MGNSESQFEGQFHQLYRFVGVVEDRVFREVKIYRKIKFNFDYMMVVQRSASEFLPNDPTRTSAQRLNNRLQMIRKYQNAFTSRLSYSIILEGKGIHCKDTRVRLFLQYYNHTLNDYLSALRGSKFVLAFEELKFVCCSLIEGMSILRKMDITEYWLSVDNVWVSVDQGNVVINPVYFIYESAVTTLRSQHIHQISQDYQPVDLSASRSHHQSHHSILNIDPLQHSQLQNILQIYMEMTRYIDPKELPSSNRLYQKLRGSRSIQQALGMMDTNCEELNVEQFGQVKEAQSLYARRLE